MAVLVIYDKNNKCYYKKIKEFGSIELLDNFTMFYSNDKELLDMLINNLKGQELGEFKSFISNTKSNYSFGVIMNPDKSNIIIPVIYSYDLFLENDLINKFNDYFFKHQKEVINRWHIGIDNVFISLDGVRIKLKNVRKTLVKEEIEYIVNSYLKGSSYKKKRDIYFKLINRGISIEKYDLKEIYKQEKKKNPFDLVKKEEFTNFLYQYSKQGNEEYDEAIDELMILYTPEDNYKKR